MILFLFILAGLLGVAGVARAGAERRAATGTRTTIGPEGFGRGATDFYPTSKDVRFGFGQGAPFVYGPPGLRRTAAVGGVGASLAGGKITGGAAGGGGGISGGRGKIA